MTHTKSELVDLDAGWDEPAPEPALAPVVPSSTPPDLGNLDEGWGEPAVDHEPRATTAQRPVGSDATTGPGTAGRDGLSLTKRERRELERRQRITRAQRQAARKQAKKQARQQAARRRNEERGEATVGADPEPERSAPVKRRHPKSAARRGGPESVTETTKADAPRLERSRRPPTETSLRNRGPSAPTENASSNMSKPRTRFVSMSPYLAGLVVAAAILAWMLLR